MLQYAGIPYDIEGRAGKGKLMEVPLDEPGVEPLFFEVAS
jgi:hypothetical protein